jgi:hypothetical protein
MGLYPKELIEFIALSGIPRGPNSHYYLVDAVHGDDGNDGNNFKKPLASLTEAEDRCVTNHHDAVILLSGPTGDTLSAALTWDKSYTHLLGWCAPTRVAQRARIFQLSTLTDASPLITISGSGNVFKDFYAFQGVADTGSLIDVSVTGGRNYFENVHFAGGGHATQAIDGGASLKLDGAEENTFKYCTVGVDTIAYATGMDCLLFDGEAHRNTFEDCLFQMWAGNGGAAWVEVADATGIDRWNRFINCGFINTGTTLTSGFVIPAGMGSPRRLFLENCRGFGATKWDANDRGVLMGNMNAVTAADLSGVMVEMIS